MKAINILKWPGVIFVFHEPLPPEMMYINPVSNIIRRIDRFVWKYSEKILRRKAPSKRIFYEDAD